MSNEKEERVKTSSEFAKGVKEIGDGVFAYLQPDGSWGLSNAGLIVGEGTSLLVDTLFDLKLTQEMLDAMKPITAGRPIDTLVNTHANGDHCYGNELVPDRAEIYATVAAAEEMTEMPAARLDAMKDSDDPEVSEFAEYTFGDFEFAGIDGRMPDRTFSGRLELEVGGRTVEVVDLGPAHTQSDSIVHVPDARTVFSGDLVFAKGTPIAWAGPISNWLAACDRICELDVETIVPGHGPVTDKDGVRAVAAYFEHVLAETKKRQEAGMDPIEAAFDIDLGPFADLGDSERIVVTVDTIYKDLDPSYEKADVLFLFGQMGRYHRGLGPRKAG